MLRGWRACGRGPSSNQAWRRLARRRARRCRRWRPRQARVERLAASQLELYCLMSSASVPAKLNVTGIARPYSRQAELPRHLRHARIVVGIIKMEICRDPVIVERAPCWRGDNASASTFG